MVQQPLPSAGSGLAKYLTSAVPYVRTYARPLLTAAVAAPLPTTPLIIGGALLVTGLTWWYFNDQNREALRNKAMAKFLANNSSKPTVSYQLRIYSTNNRHTTGFDVYPFNTPLWAYSDYRISDNMPRYPEIDTIEEGRYYIEGYLNRPNSSGGPFWQSMYNVDPRTLVITLLNPPNWSNLSDSERQQAVDSLDDSDWEDIVRAMPAGGTLSEGDILGREILLTGDSDSIFESLRKGRIVPPGTKIPTILEGQEAAHLQTELDKLKADLADLPTALNRPGLGTIGASLAGLTGLVRNTDTNVAKVGEAVAASQVANNDNFNEVKKRLKSVAGFLNFDRILNILIWVNTLHNAFMISADLARSLLSMVSTSLKALPGDSLLGLPTESADGAPLDLATVINKSIEKWIIGAVGAKNYKLMALELAQVNRIYQSVSNLSSETSSILDSFRGPIAAGFERISQVGNALRRNGIVRDDSYPAMNEKVTIRSKGLSRLDRATDRLESLNNAVSVVESIASSVVSIQEEVTEIKKYRKEYEDEKAKLIKEIEKKEVDSKKASTAPDIKEEDEERHAA